MKKAVVRSAHDVPDLEPIVVEPGQQVEVGERDGEWPAFVFVSTESGGGWVPSRMLSADSGPATVLARYDTAELATLIGEVLEIVEEDRESGWLRCRSAAGVEGWVPADTVHEVEGDG